MGLFDNIAGAVLGKLGGEQGSMVQIAMDLFHEHGGLSGILEKFKENGMAAEAASWVGKGANLPISAEQVASVLGDGEIAQMAAKFNISPEALSRKIAEYLPMVVDKLTPDGEVKDGSGNVLTTLLSMLK